MVLNFKRSVYFREIEQSLAHFGITALLGPRHCGKTTLARKFLESPVNYFDLGDPLDVARLNNPREILGSLNGLVILDEFQRMPELLPILHYLADRDHFPARFLILGSTSLVFMTSGAESLVGRVNVIHLGGFSCVDVGIKNRDTLWFRGGFPQSFLARDDEESSQWRRQFIEGFLQTGLADFGVDLSPERLRRFWTMAAHYHGRHWNSSAIASSLDISHTTARSYLDRLSEALVMRQVRPWLPNLKKRMVKSPKVYLCDSGLHHSLLQIETRDQLYANPCYAASWEGFAFDQVREVLRLQPDEIYFWATHAGAKMDLVVARGGKLYGFEFKVTENPSTTHSMTIAKKDLGLEHVYLVYPGELTISLRDGMTAVGYQKLPELELESPS